MQSGSDEDQQPQQQQLNIESAGGGEEEQEKPQPSASSAYSLVLNLPIARMAFLLKHYTCKPARMCQLITSRGYCKCEGQVSIHLQLAKDRGSLKTNTSFLYLLTKVWLRKRNIFQFRPKSATSPTSINEFWPISNRPLVWTLSTRWDIFSKHYWGKFLYHFFFRCKKNYENFVYLWIL